MIPDQANTVSMTSLMDTARTILEAANDLGDSATVKVCRRVIDTALRDGTFAQSDINAIFEFFEGCPGKPTLEVLFAIDGLALVSMATAAGTVGFTDFSPVS
jgi:hypothetical protein